MSILTQHPQLTVLQQLARQRKVKVYLVGGFLRDRLLERPCLDFDFAVGKGAVALARAFARKVKGAFVLLDAEHGCGRVVKKDNGRILTFDFADFRKSTLRGDLRHRDFTVNTLCADIAGLDSGVSLDVKDALGGLKDIKARVIRMTGPGVFQEDPLRIMRAYSLQAQLGFKIERATAAQIKKDRELIRVPAAERIREELFKIFESPRAAAALRALDRAGLLERVIPQITVMYGVRQGTYHHLDVWPHSLETVAQVEKVFEEYASDPDVSAYLAEPLGGAHSRRAVIKLAALLHDVGKPQTRRNEPGGRISFHGHENVGRAITRHAAKQLKISTKERYALEDMVRMHLRPGYLSNFKRPSDKAVFRYFRDAGDEAAAILLLSLADQRSTCGPATTAADQKHHDTICRGLLKSWFARKKEKPVVRLISGHDLIKKLKLKPSPLFAQILGAVEEQQAVGKITSAHEALEMARKIAEKK